MQIIWINFLSKNKSKKGKKGEKAFLRYDSLLFVFKF